MTPSKPYLIRALYDWIHDNDGTAYILVNALTLGCKVPQAHVVDGRIIFNITKDVVHDLILGNEAIEFTARFSNIPTPIYLPMAAVLAIYAKENGEGMAFPEETVTEGDLSSSLTKKSKGKPKLKIVK